jgi:MFS family permease
MNGPPSERLLAVTLVLICLVNAVLSSLGAPLIPDIAREFHQSLGAAQWSLTVSLMAGAVAAPILGRLGDGPSVKRTMVGALLFVTVGGVLAALAPNIATLLVGRAMQGAGMGLVPLAMAAAREYLSAARVAPTIAILSVSVGVGAGAGYPISGLIAEAWGVRGAYVFGAIASGVALAGAAAVLPGRSSKTAPGGFDRLGGALLTMGLVATLLGTAQGSEWGWGSARIAGLLAAGGILFAVWAAQQLRAAAPLVQLRLVRYPAVLVGDACGFVLGMSMYMSTSAATEFVQADRSQGFGLSATTTEAGLLLIPMSILMLFGSRTLPFLVPRFGMRGVLSGGSLVVAAGSMYFALLHSTLLDAYVLMAAVGIGLGLTSAAIPGLIVQAIPARETGSAMGFYAVVRNIGSSIGSALTAAIVVGHESPAHQPTEQGYTAVFWGAAIVCVVGAVLAHVLTARQSRRPNDDQLPELEVHLLEETDGQAYLPVSAEASKPTAPPTNAPAPCSRTASTSPATATSPESLRSRAGDASRTLDSW